MKMLSYHNKPNLKKMMLLEVAKHRKADQIIQGTYGEGEGKSWRGCAVGCSIHSLNIKLKKEYRTNDHGVYEKELGIPEQLAYLEDQIFEMLPIEKAKLWPERFLKAVPVGKDLSKVIAQFVIWRFEDGARAWAGAGAAEQMADKLISMLQEA